MGLINYESTTELPFPIGHVEKIYDIIRLLGLDERKLWALFDGRSSSENGKQFVMGVYPNQHFQFMVIDVETGERAIDFALDGHIIATIHQDTEKFGEWTPVAKMIASVPVLVAALEEIANGELPYNPKALALAALQYMERKGLHE